MTPFTQLLFPSHVDNTEEEEGKYVLCVVYVGGRIGNECGMGFKRMWFPLSWWYQRV